MRRCPRLLTLAAAVVALSGCGGDGGEPRPVAPAPASPQAENPPKPPPVGDGRGGIRLTKLGGFDAPLHVAQPPGDRRDLFVVEQGGRVWVARDGRVLAEPFLDLGGEITSGGEQGLLSIAFAPDYRRSGRLYVDYTDTAGDTRVVEFRRSRESPLRADPSSRRELLKVDQPPYPNHKGGLVLFGPDGLLYIGLGDGGAAGDPNRNGQDLSTPLAKILRIDPRPDGERPYRIPADNPFADREGAVPEAYAYGLRNPWRFSFDRATGALTIADVGQQAFEEINYLTRGKGAGANFGWSAYEGNTPFNADQSAPGHVRPVLTYGRDRGCSVTGGYVVRDRSLRSLYGRYLYADYCEGELRSFVPGPGTARDDRPVGPVVPSVSSFGEDGAGRVYVTSLEGPVYRIDPAGR